MGHTIQFDQLTLHFAGHCVGAFTARTLIRILPLATWDSRLGTITESQKARCLVGIGPLFCFETDEPGGSEEAGRV